MSEEFSKQHLILQKAIENIEVFTKFHEFEVGEDGRLITAESSRLEKIVKLASHALVPLLFSRKIEEHKNKVLRIKQAILDAREIIQSNATFIADLRRGTETERKFADYALRTITTYNRIVSKTCEEKIKDDSRYEKHLVLSDHDIEGVLIDFPARSISLKEELPDREENSREIPGIRLSDKKLMQFMIDTFRMKAIRMMMTHLSKSHKEVVPLIKRENPEIAEEDGSVIVKQSIEVSPETTLTLIGNFRKRAQCGFPHIESFNLKTTSLDDERKFKDSLLSDSKGGKK